MNKAFEKILERLEENKSIVPVNRVLDDIIKDKPKELGQLIAYDNSIKIVQEVAKEYNDGLIPCSTRQNAMKWRLLDMTIDEAITKEREIAEWQEELKACRENYASYIMEDIEVTQNAMYNKAIYDFALALKNNFEDLPIIISKESFLDFINDNADLLIRGK